MGKIILAQGAKLHIGSNQYRKSFRTDHAVLPLALNYSRITRYHRHGVSPVQPQDKQVDEINGLKLFDHEAVKDRVSPATAG